MIEDAIEHLDGDLRHAVGVDVVAEQVADHPPCPGHREPAKEEALLVHDPTPVDPHVGPPGLAAARQGELVDVRAEIADAVQGRRGRVRDDREVVVIETLPGRSPRIELQPRGAEAQVVGLRGAPNAVDAVRDALEQTGLDQPRDPAPADVGRPGLLEGDQAPLALRSPTMWRRGAYVAGSTLAAVVQWSTMANLAPQGP